MATCMVDLASHFNTYNTNFSVKTQEKVVFLNYLLMFFSLHCQPTLTLPYTANHILSLSSSIKQLIKLYYTASNDQGAAFNDQGAAATVVVC